MIHRVRPVRRDLDVEDDDAVSFLNGLDRQPRAIEQPPHGVGRAGVRERDVVAQPVERELHDSGANCERNRSSPSKRSRRSGNS